MIKVQFCCGGNHPEGWINHDMEVDISGVLPYLNDSVDRIFCEHGIEHITQYQAVCFLAECRRILKKSGVVCILFPDAHRIITQSTPKYREFIRSFGSDGTLEGSVRSIVFNHAHKSFWGTRTMLVAFIAAGFDLTNMCEVDGSAFIGLPGHGKVIGEEMNTIETSTVMAVK